MSQVAAESKMRRRLAIPERITLAIIKYLVIIVIKFIYCTVKIAF